MYIAGDYSDNTDPVLVHNRLEVRMTGNVDGFEAKGWDEITVKARGPTVGGSLLRFRHPSMAPVS